MEIIPRLTGIFTYSPQAIQEMEDLKYHRESKTLQEIIQADSKELIKLQQEAGFSLISDGQRSWGDLLRPLGRAVDDLGITKTMLRWFETNGFYYALHFVDQAARENFNDYIFSNAEEMTLTFPGLYTLARLTIGQEEYSKDEFSQLDYYEDALDVYSNALKKIISDLPPEIKVLEFSEPSMIYDRTINFPLRKSLLNLARVAYGNLLSETNIITILQVPDGDINLVPEVFSYPTSGIGVDLTETKELYNSLDLQNKILSAGILNAWTSEPENLEKCAARIKSFLPRWSQDKLFITTNAQLYHTIPYQGAVQKIKDLRRLHDLISAI